MSVLIVPDSFKGTYTAAEVAGHIATGVGRAGGTAVGIPVADGGEGTFDALCAGLGAVEVKVSVRNPWGSPVTATLGLAGDTAIVELAQASGLHVLHNGERDPLTADTYGTGQLILEAVARGARRVLVAAGGSATTDGGTGAVRAITQAGGLHGAQIIVLSDVTTKFPDAARILGHKGRGPGHRRVADGEAAGAGAHLSPRPFRCRGNRGCGRFFRRIVGALRGGTGLGRRVCA